MTIESQLLELEQTIWFARRRRASTLVNAARQVVFKLPKKVEEEQCLTMVTNDPSHFRYKCLDSFYPHKMYKWFTTVVREWRNAASLTNQTSIFGIMGGLVPSTNIAQG